MHRGQKHYIHVSLVIMKYKVHIEEILAKDIFVEAETRQDAYNYVQDKINKEEIILSADDFTGCRFVDVFTATPVECRKRDFEHL